MKPIIIFGAGQLAEVAYFYFTRDANRKIAAFTVDGKHSKENILLDTPIIPFENIPERFEPAEYDIFIAIGSSGVNRNRKEKCSHIKSLGFRLASYISSKSLIWTENIGEHAFILEHNTIQPYASIGNNVIVWSGNHIGHHVTIEDHCFITSHVVISGAASIGEGTFLGVNATIRDHIQIGKYNIIGAGAIILENTGDEEVYACTTTGRHPFKSHQLAKI